MISSWWLVAIIAIFIVRDSIYFIRNSAGTLRIDRSVPGKEIYKIEINELDRLAKRKFIILKVDNKADFSQK